MALKHTRLSRRLWVKGLRVLRVELNGVEAPDGIDVNPGQQITGARVVFTKASGAIRGQVKLIGALPEIATAQSNAQAPQRDGRPRTASIGGRVTVGGAP